ncbi:MAG: hypothetical protein ACI94Y_001339 [Maribacter sp.]|jgi:uncharacterized protein (TIGR02231 family)
MKRLFFLLGIFLMSIPNSSFAETIPSIIESVTVFKQNAKVTRAATITLKKGNNEIILGDLTQSILVVSLQVQVKGDATLLSAAHRTNYLKDMEKPKKVAAIQDSLENLTYDLQWLKNELLILQGEEKIITQNNPLGSKKDEGFTVEEIQKLTIFYRKRLTEIKRKILDTNRESKKLQAEINRLNTHLNYINQQGSKPTGEIVLHFFSPSDKTIPIKCSYLINNAGWTPLYDLKSKAISSPVQLVYKANVYQNSGQDWKNVKMKVSTNNPAANNSRPILNPRYVQFYVVAQSAYLQKPSYSESNMNMATVPMDNARIDNSALKNSPGLDLSEYPPQSEPMTMEFDVPYKQEIPSDGVGHIVLMEEYSLSADYTYHVVPKVDLGVYLIAKITDYGQYNLVAGNANIFFEDTYVGQSHINPAITADTLLLSFGRDERITVKRTRPNNLEQKKTKTGIVKETFGYEIKVRNNKSVAIDIEILDQVPLSQNKEIEVKLTESKEAKYNKEYGKLLWKERIFPGNSKTVRFEYWIKYPKGKYLTGT